jgi:hypothetical protein
MGKGSRVEVLGFAQKVIDSGEIVREYRVKEGARGGYVPGAAIRFDDPAAEKASGNWRYVSPE